MNKEGWKEYIGVRINFLELNIRNKNKIFNTFLDSKYERDNYLERIKSKEFLSIVVSKKLLNDLRYIQKIEEMNFLSDDSKYKTYILRSIFENVIEYKYLILNDYLINEFFGIHIDNHNVIDIRSRNKLKRVLRSSNRERYIEKDISINDMCSCIEENEDNRVNSILHDMYKQLVNYSHTINNNTCAKELAIKVDKNYVLDIDDIENIRDLVEGMKSGIDFNGYELMYINSIIDIFLSTYNSLNITASYANVDM